MTASSGIVRNWLLVGVVATLLVAHGLGIYVMRHFRASATVLSLVAVVVALKHLGLISSGYAMIRRRFLRGRSISHRPQFDR